MKPMPSHIWSTAMVGMVHNLFTTPDDSCPGGDRLPDGYRFLVTDSIGNCKKGSTSNKKSNTRKCVIPKGAKVLVPVRRRRLANIATTRLRLSKKMPRRLGRHSSHSRPRLMARRSLSLALNPLTFSHSITTSRSAPTVGTLSKAAASTTGLEFRMACGCRCSSSSKWESTPSRLVVVPPTHRLLPDDV